MIRLYGKVSPFVFILMISSVFAHYYFIFISNFTNKKQRYPDPFLPFPIFLPFCYYS